MYYIIAL